jgi:hypothetical protein
MTAFDEMTDRLRKQAAESSDPTRSTVAEEIDGMNKQFGELTARINELEICPDKTARSYAAKAARWHLDVLAQHAHRVKLLAQGQPKQRNTTEKVSSGRAGVGLIHGKTTKLLALAAIAALAIACLAFLVRHFNSGAVGELMDDVVPAFRGFGFFVGLIAGFSAGFIAARRSKA